MKRIIRIVTLLLFALLIHLCGCTADDPGYVNVLEGNLADDSEIIIKGSTNTGTYQVVELDPSTYSIICIDSVHHEIHEGDHYYIEGFVTLMDTNTLYVKLVTPDTTKWAHFTWEIVAGGILETNFYEDATGGMGGGANVVPLNNNRNSPNTSDLVITSGVTAATDNGTRVSAKKVGGTGFKEAIGGAADRSNELILKQNTVYFREFISGSDDNIISFRASWYEHTNKEP